MIPLSKIEKFPFRKGDVVFCHPYDSLFVHLFRVVPATNIEACKGMDEGYFMPRNTQEERDETATLA